MRKIVDFTLKADEINTKLKNLEKILEPILPGHVSSYSDSFENPTGESQILGDLLILRTVIKNCNCRISNLLNVMDL
jgi:hypothetical protein